MLTVTPNAQTTLTARRAEKGAPETYGVRFYTKQIEDGGMTRLAFSFVPAPKPDDTVIKDGKDGNLKAFVAPEVGESIGDVVVDVRDESGTPSLVVKRLTERG